MKKSNIFYLALGLVMGGVIFGGTVAYAAGVIAQQKTAGVVIDGQAVDLEGYLIEGSHYFQLRDLDAALTQSGKDFSLVWDGSGNRIILDTSRGYDPDELYVSAVTALPDPEPATSAAPEPDMTVAEMKAEIIRLTNVERVNAGLPELEILPELMDCAQTKADDMKENGYFSHISPTYGTSGEMIRSFVSGTNGSGENIKSLIAWNGTLQEAFEGWIESPEHSRTMLNSSYTHTGVGIAVSATGAQKWVQQFVVL